MLKVVALGRVGEHGTWVTWRVARCGHASASGSTNCLLRIVCIGRLSARAVGTSGHAQRGLTRSRPDPAAAKSYMPLRTLPNMPCMPLSYMLCVLLWRNEPRSDPVLGDSGAYPAFEGRLGCEWKRISIRRHHGVQGPASNGLESQRSLGFFLGVLASVSLGDDGRVAARERC